jgi:uncharacterized membrane protein YdjX (TVP38/TMEM64 family)
MNDKDSKIDSRLIAAVLMMIIILLGYLIYKFFGNDIAAIWQLLQDGDQSEISAFLNSKSQAGGYFVLYLSCILQVVSIFFPGMVIQIAGALIYGWWKAFLICWIGFISGNALVFLVARVLGKSLNMAFATEGKKTSWLMEKINDGNQIWVVAMACLVPGVPNGIIPYLAARTKITLKEFTLAIAGSSWIQIILNCFAGHFLARGQYAFTIAAFALQIVLLIVVAKNRDKLLKK